MMLIILVILVASIILNPYMMRREARRRQYEHERRMKRFERLMTMLQMPNSDKEAQVSNLRGEAANWKQQVIKRNYPDSYRD